jgi:hypothetical protein
MVVDNLRSERGNHLLDACLVSEVNTMSFHSWVEVGIAASAEVVQDGDLMAGRDVGVDHVGTDETGATRHQNPHRA